MPTGDWPTVRLTRRTLQDNVYDNLRKSLMSGSLPPGTRLTVRGIGERMGTSAMPVREAFRRLTSEGALEPLSTGETRVPVLSVEQIIEITDIRLEVEGLATRRAAERITDEQLAALESANTEMLAAIRARDAAAEAQANEKFHFTIYRAADSDEILRIVDRLWIKIGPCLIDLLSDYEHSGNIRSRNTAKDHAAIIHGLRKHDPIAAEAALRADLSAGAAFLTTQAQRARDKDRTTHSG